MRLNAVLNLQFDIPAVADDGDEDAAVNAVCAALAELDLADLVSLATPEHGDDEVSYTINLDGSPVEPAYEPCPWCASRAFGIPCPTHGATYQSV